MSLVATDNKDGWGGSDKINRFWFTKRCDFSHGKVLCRGFFLCYSFCLVSLVKSINAIDPNKCKVNESHLCESVLYPTLGRGGALVESKPSDRRVVGSNPARYASGCWVDLYRYKNITWRHPVPSAVKPTYSRFQEAIRYLFIIY